jgi:hypothetical protein
MIKVSYVYRSLLWPFFLFFILLVVSLFVYSLVEDYKEKIEKNYHLQLAEVDTLYNEINDIKDKIELVNVYFERFQFVKGSGYLNNQSRVNWIDGLIELASVYGVRGVTFNFSSRDMLDSAQQPSLAPFLEVVQREYLDIEGEFQHEVDVFNFVTDIVQKVNRLAVLESCNLISLNQKNQYGLTGSYYTFQLDKGNVAIKCRFNFLALNVPKVTSTSEIQP